MKTGSPTSLPPMPGTFPASDSQALPTANASSHAPSIHPGRNTVVVPADLGRLEAALSRQANAPASTAERLKFLGAQASRRIVCQTAFATAGAGMTHQMLKAGLNLERAVLVGQATVALMKETLGPALDGMGPNLALPKDGALGPDFLPNKLKPSVETFVRTLDGLFEGGCYEAGATAIGVITKAIEASSGKTGKDILTQALKENGGFVPLLAMFGVGATLDFTHDMLTAMVKAATPSASYRYDQCELGKLANMVPLDKKSAAKLVGSLIPRGGTILGTWAGAKIMENRTGGIAYAQQGAQKGLGGMLSRFVQPHTKYYGAQAAEALVTSSPSPLPTAASRPATAPISPAEIPLPHSVYSESAHESASRHSDTQHRSLSPSQADSPPNTEPDIVVQDDNIQAETKRKSERESLEDELMHQALMWVQQLSGDNPLSPLATT